MDLKPDKLTSMLVAQQISWCTVDGDTGVGAPTRLYLNWTATEPWLVLFHFPDVQKRPEGVTWIVGRAFLANGLCGPIGEGDIRFNPDQDHVEITLASHEGNATFRIDRQDVAEFLADTYNIVCPATETTMLNPADEVIWAWMDEDEAA